VAAQAPGASFEIVVPGVLRTSRSRGRLVSVVAPDEAHVGPAPAALAGAIAAGAALGVSELVTGIAGEGPSLVSAIGTEFIDRFAGSLKDLAVSLFGTNDKTALVVGIVIVSVLLGALFGVVAARRFWFGAAGFVLFGVVGAWAYNRDPFGSAGVGVTAAVIAVAAGVATLRFLLRAAEPVGGTAPPESVGETAAADESAVVAPPPPSRTGTPRRTFIVGAVALGAGAAASAALGRRLRSSGGAESARRTVTIPRPASVQAVPTRQPFTVSGLSPYVTPNDDFYRIDTALVAPPVDVESWQLSVSGMVDEPFSIGYDELLSLASDERAVTLQCVSNEIGGNLVGNAVWQGVPLELLLDRAGVQDGATQIVGRSVDGWTAGFPTELGRDGRVAMVAYAMNDQPLPVNHGFPARLMVAGLYGYVSATKWLSEIELTTWDGFDAYWITRGWGKKGPIKTASRIDVPRSGATVPAGRTAVAGVAWAPTRGIERVELQVDADEWQECRLGDVASKNTWVQWVLEWDAAPGDHVLTVRATDGDGQTQTSEIQPPIPDGATGWHSRRVSVDGST
jgi:DMSO/TMAO reductase YedYZ molybdopterin-dependent catalytic subunit